MWLTGNDDYKIHCKVSFSHELHNVCTLSLACWELLEIKAAAVLGTLYCGLDCKQLHNKSIKMRADYTIVY